MLARRGIPLRGGCKHAVKQSARRHAATPACYLPVDVAHSDAKADRSTARASQIAMQSRERLRRLQGGSAHSHKALSMSAQRARRKKSGKVTFWNDAVVATSVRFRGLTCRTCVFSVIDSLS